MKNTLLTFLFVITGLLGYAQSYPRIETDSTGKKLVVMTYEQAQKIDNAFEMLILLEKAGVECDSLSLSYVKVIDEYKHQVTLLQTDILLYKNQISDKDNQISNLKERLVNFETNAATCDQQISARDKQIGLLEDEVKTLKTKRNVAYGVGVVGVIGGILLVLFFH